MIINANQRRNRVQEYVAPAALAATVAGLPVVRNAISNLLSSGIAEKAAHSAGKKAKTIFVEAVKKKSRPSATKGLSTSKVTNNHEEKKTSSNVFVGPTVVGNCTGASYHRIKGNPQVLTDQTGNTSFSGVRVEFADVIPGYVARGTEPLNAGLNPGLQFGATQSFYAEISPAIMSRRLSQLSSMYEFYAFRKLRFEFIPSKSTAQDGQVVMGVMRDVGSFNDAALSTSFGFQNLMEMECSASTSAWSIGSITMEFKGTRLWYTESNSGATHPHTFENDIQSLLLVGLSGIATEGGTIPLGHIRVVGICDLYRPAYVERGTINSVINYPLFREYLRTYLTLPERPDFLTWKKSHQGKSALEKIKTRAIRELTEEEQKEWEKC